MVLIKEIVNTKGERLVRIRESLGFTKAKPFADLIDEHVSNYYGIESGDRNLGKYKSIDILNKINSLSDEIRKGRLVNAQWWETGQGEIFLPQSLPVNDKDKVIPINFVDETDVTISASGMEFRDLDNGMVLMTIPLVDEFAYASYPHGWKDPEYLIELPKYSIVLPKRERGIFRAFEVRGDSMDDGSKFSIGYGDVAIGRKIETDFWDVKLYTNGGTDYVIVTHDGVVIKRITKHDTKEGIITCSSINPDKKEYPDYDVRLTEVYELYKVRKVDRDWSRR